MFPFSTCCLAKPCGPTCCPLRSCSPASRPRHKPRQPRPGRSPPSFPSKARLRQACGCLRRLPQPGAPDRPRPRRWSQLRRNTMLPLEHLQTTMARSVLAMEPVVAANVLTAGKADPLARLRIYQNNTRSSLTGALMAVFPVTVRLIDERFFRYVASEFIRRYPPVESRLSRYGAGFPRFLKTIDTLSDMPIVAETARLEWAIAEALDTAS